MNLVEIGETKKILTTPQQSYTKSLVSSVPPTNKKISRFVIVEKENKKNKENNIKILTTDKKELVNINTVFDKIFDADNHPVLFHCTAGKDRTGFVAAAILKFLGVDDETVFADYLLTNELLGKRTEERLKVWAKRMSQEQGIAVDEVHGEALNALRILMLTHSDMLQSTFDAVNELFGSWDEMRRTGLGISDGRMDAFRSAVLTKSSL